LTKKGNLYLGKGNMIKRRKDYTGIDKKCHLCGITYNDVPERRLIYCSDVCFRKATKKKTEKTCKQCHSIFYSIPNRNKHFCSNKCNGEFMRGMVRDQSIGKKISISKTKYYGEVNIKRMRKSADYYKVRKIVFDRDYSECQMCGGVATDLHHIVPVTVNMNMAFEQNHCVAVCKLCHDTIISKKESDWESYFYFCIESKLLNREVAGTTPQSSN
jgi:hypothetical protein